MKLPRIPFRHAPEGTVGVEPTKIRRKSSYSHQQSRTLSYGLIFVHMNYDDYIDQSLNEKTLGFQRTGSNCIVLTGVGICGKSTRASIKAVTFP